MEDLFLLVNNNKNNFPSELYKRILSHIKETYVKVYEYNDNKVCSENWYDAERNLVKSKDYFENGNVMQEQWYKEGVYHKEGGPAEIFYFSNGNMRYEAWVKEGTIHREDGPAVTTYYTDGTKKSEEWVNDGLVYRRNTVTPGRIRSYAPIK